VLAGGFFGIEFGTVMLLLAFMNRASDRTRAALQRLFLYVGGTCLAESLLLKLEYIDRSDMHSALFFIVVSIGTPAILVAIGVASARKWACTIVSAIYMAFGVALLWILPLVPAEPKLGPVYIPVTHLIPWEFPLLIVAPALVVDLILQRTERWRPLARATAAGLAFFVTFAAVQWPFANFLMTPLARNAIIGAHYMGYNTRPGTPYATFQFFARESATTFWRGMVIATLITCVMMWLGLHAGLAMKRIKR
jgi:hypothetical protein